MRDIHSCSYHCDRPECIKAQRDELRERLAQPEQEPQRTWVGLTDEEYDEIWRMDLNNKEIMDKTIAKLKEKNNG